MREREGEREESERERRRVSERERSEREKEWDYQVSICSGQVASLPGAETTSVLDLAEDEVFADLERHDADQPVVDEDPLAFGHDLKSKRNLFQELVQVH